MNILVTGSAGMIGSYVVKGLIDKGHTVIGVDRIARDTNLLGLTQIILDLSSKEGILQLFDDKKIDQGHCQCSSWSRCPHTAYTETRSQDP